MKAQSTPRKILLIGASGSIGTQTLDVLRQHPEVFELVGISVGSNVKKMQEIIDEFPSIQAAGASVLKEDTQYNGIPVYSKDEQMKRLCESLDYDLLVNAAVGFRGLEPTLCALGRGIDVALANKESLVCGGELVLEAMKKNGAKLQPIDSEHSAIYQCLQQASHQAVRRLIITASGGSLRDLDRSQLLDITPEQALKHPSWNMGARITIDSATMVNKGFEVIEAHYLFDMPYEKISTVLHKQSIVHSMVEFEDNAVLAQLGSADMRLPIQFALYGHHEKPLAEEDPLDMTKALTLDFKEMDFERFPMLETAVAAGKRKGNAGCIFNAADEQAVALFLDGKIPFLAIEEAIRSALENVEFIENPDFEDLKKTDQAAREHVKELYL